MWQNKKNKCDSEIDEREQAFNMCGQTPHTHQVRDRWRNDDCVLLNSLEFSRFFFKHHTYRLCPLFCTAGCALNVGGEEERLEEGDDKGGEED